MTADEIYELARKRQPAPDDLTLPDRLLYTTARNIYKSYSDGIISLEQAKQEKSRSISEFERLNLKLREFTAAAEQELTVIHTHGGISVPCKITGVMTRFSKKTGWTYSLELQEVNSFCVIIAGLDDVEVKQNG